MNRYFHKKTSNGFSLIEMLIYVSILAIVLLLVVQTALSFTGSFRNLQVLRAVDRSAYNSLERMTRDIRNADAVNLTQSYLGASPGILVLTQTSGSNSTTTRFYVQNQVINVDVNGISIGPLMVARTAVTSLVFTQIAGTSTAVKIDMTLTASSGPVIRTKSFHSTVILKGS
jgi:prepilin-type N-terminal cleavage/methylation domain-containing protein